MAKTRKTKVKQPASDDVFDVEKIVDKRDTSKGVEYYVKWRGYPSHKNTWEPEENIMASQLIKDYEAVNDKGDNESEPKNVSIRGNLRFSPAPAPKNTETSPKKTKPSPKKAKASPRVIKSSPKKTKASARVSRSSPSVTKLSPRIVKLKKIPARGKRKSLSGVVPKTTRRAPARSRAKPSEPERGETQSPAVASGDEVFVELDDMDVETQDDDAVTTQSPEEIDFSSVKNLKVIDESGPLKRITFAGKYLNDSIVIRLDKLPMDEETIKKALIDGNTQVKRNFVNDVYSNYLIEPSLATLNGLQAYVVWPANETVLDKYSKVETILYTETPDTYQHVVEPFIENKVTKEKDYNQWVFNILDGKAESERIVFNDPDPDSGFIIVLDFKWTGDEDHLNLIAICHRHDIRSLRDLNGKHLVLLKNIMTKGTKAIKDKYKNFKGQLRSYVHYHPTFYHFHVHFKVVDPADYLCSDRDHLLSTIIDNISMKKDYYKKATLTYPLGQSAALYEELKKSKRV